MADKPIVIEDINDIDTDPDGEIEEEEKISPLEVKPPQRRGGQRGGQSHRGAPRAAADEDGGGRGAGGKRPTYFQGRRKVCPIKIEEVNWKNLDALRYFVNESGSIRSRRKTGANAKLQRRVAIAVKRARHMALLPFTGDHVRTSGRR